MSQRNRKVGNGARWGRACVVVECKRNGERGMNAGSLFSGVGGFDLGFERAGIHTVWQVEKDKYARATLAKHFPNAMQYEDVNHVGRNNLAPVDLISGGFPCFPAGTLIFAKRGYVPIEEVEIGDMVFTHQGRWKPVIQVMRRDGAPLVKVKGRGSNGITTTREHPFYSCESFNRWSKRDGKRIRELAFTSPDWTDASEMTGKYWASPAAFPKCDVPPFILRHVNESLPCEVTTAFFWFVGAWVGDGWIRRHKRYDRNTNKTNDQVFLCANKKESREIAYRIEQAGLASTLSVTRTTDKYIITSKPLARWLSSHFGEGAANKGIPSWLMGAPAEMKLAFIEGYMFADGSQTGPNSFRSTTVSKALAHGLKLLCQSVGYSSSVWRYEVAATTEVEGRVVNQKTQYQVSVNKNSRTMHFVGSHVWGRVKESENAGVGTVYNIGVETDESYIADGYVVHNCQDVSVAGNRAGLAGKRSGLWFEFERILSELRPRWCVIENVSGLLSSNGGRDFATVIRGLVNIGYGVCWRVLDAQYFGVAQRRRRVFIVGHLGDGRAAEVLFERESVPGDSPPRRATGKGIAATLSAQSPSRRNGGSDPAAGHFVTGTLSASDAGTARTGNARSEADMLVFRNRAYGDYVDSAQSSTLQASDDITTGDEIARRAEAIGWKWNANTGWTFNKEHTPPLTAHGARGSTDTAVGVRRLTPTECERLQGFPDGWTAMHSDTQRYKQMGNAVTVNVAEWIGRRIAAVDAKHYPK